MLDYSALCAVAAVVREGTFERAAQSLNLTPSAVSQRVKLLEERVGRILIQRGRPCTATPDGTLLLRHLETVNLLEHELATALPWASKESSAATVPTLRIAVNADSLASWFLPALKQMREQHDVLFELVIEDQDHTLELMRRGEVLAAVTATAQPLQGFTSTGLGSLRYLATASAEFVAHHFAGGVTADALRRAPSLRFNAKDSLQSLWISTHLNADLSPPCHWVASSEAFVRAALAGLGWGMNPASMVAELLESGELVELLPGKDLEVPLYWHAARCQPSLLKTFGSCVENAAGAVLIQRV